MNINQAIVFDVPFAASEDEREKENVCLELWQRAIAHVNHVLEASDQLDIVQFKAKTHPSIAQLLASIGHAESLLNLMATTEGLTFGASNALLNCSRAFAELRVTFQTVVRQDVDAYTGCLARLNVISGGAI